MINTYAFQNLLIIPETKNPTNVGLDIVERVRII